MTAVKKRRDKGDIFPESWSHYPDTRPSHFVYSIANNNGRCRSSLVRAFSAGGGDLESTGYVTTIMPSTRPTTICPGN